MCCPADTLDRMRERRFDGLPAERRRSARTLLEKALRGRFQLRVAEEPGLEQDLPGPNTFTDDLAVVTSTAVVEFDVQHHAIKRSTSRLNPSNHKHRIQKDYNHTCLHARQMKGEYITSSQH